MTFSSFDHHSSQLFKSLEIIKFFDLVTFVIATFMNKFHNQLLHSINKNASSLATDAMAFGLPFGDPI